MESVSVVFFTGTPAATAVCCDWWRPCPCLRGSATPCWGCWRAWLRLSTRCPRLLCWGWEGARTFGSLRCSRLLHWPGACRIWRGQGTRLPRTLCLDEMVPDGTSLPRPPCPCAAAFSSSSRSSSQGGRTTLGSSLYAAGMDGVVPGAGRARPVE